jgi:hypothetical protein
MAELPKNLALASGFVEARAEDVWTMFRDLNEWPKLFSAWIESIEDEDDRFTATGFQREMFDLYAKPDAEQMLMEVEVVDELGSADTLRLRVLSMPGGTLVIAAHGRLNGTSDVAWDAKRDAVDASLKSLSADQF